MPRNGENMSSHITTGQLRHLLDLDENGPGLGAELNAFIRQVTSGGLAGKSSDPRIIQAKKLWDLGFGRELKYGKFDDYLATIPAIPASLLADSPGFPLLTLVDPRLGHVESCRVPGLKFAEYGYDDTTLEPCDKRHTIPTTAPYWVRAHDGKPNVNRKPSDCRAECTGKSFAGTAEVGIAIYVQHGKRGHFMDLPGVVHHGARGYCAFIVAWDGEPELYARRDDGADPSCGTVIFVRE